MGHFSDQYHLDTCAGKYCGAMLQRSQMQRIKGRRGYFCEHCYPKYLIRQPNKNLPKNTQLMLDLSEKKD